MNVTNMVDGVTSHQAMCQGLCAGADAAMAVPIIGWIIAAALVGAAIDEGGVVIVVATNQCSQLTLSNPAFE